MENEPYMNENFSLANGNLTESHTDEDLPSNEEQCQPFTNEGLQQRTEIRPRAKYTPVRWTPTLERYYVQLLLEQVQLGNTTDTGFKKVAWRFMISEFNKKFGLDFHIRHLKYRLKSFKKQQNTVKELRNTPGFSWDESRYIVMADDEVWDQYLSVYPEAAIYRTKVWPLYDELNMIFGNTAFDDGKILSNFHQSPDGEYDHTELTQMITGVESPTFSSDPILQQTSTQNEVHSDENTDILHTQRHYHYQPTNPRSSNQIKRSRKRCSDHMADALNEMAAMTARMRSAPKPIISEKSTLQRCIEELQMIEGLDTSVIVDAIDILKDEKNSIIFLTLKGDLRKEWLKKMCTKL